MVVRQFIQGVFVKRKYFLLVSFILCACISIFLLWSYREQPLNDLLPGEGKPKYASMGYYDGMESQTHIIGEIPGASISALIDSTTIRKGNSSRALPSPCFEITVIYTDRTYRVVIGADKTISVAPIGDLNSCSFWIDVNGALFEQLYSIHLENGGQVFP